MQEESCDGSCGFCRRGTTRASGIGGTVEGPVGMGLRLSSAECVGGGRVVR